MQILIIILIVIVAIVALILIAALFAKKGYSIQREIVINKPVSGVFNYIKFLKNQDYFNKWVMMDPNMKKEFKGTDGTVGFIYAWDGNKKAGAGEQEIKKITDNQSVNLEVRFIRPFAGIAHTPFITEAIDNNQTKLRWEIESTMKYPMNVMLLFMNMDKLLGNDMETSLRNLKDILEKN